MFGVGAFARLAQVSVRTLHHYDALGLLPPAAVDPNTGYRWYRGEQLRRLNRILALRDLGMSLTEIQSVVDDAVTSGELRGMLRLRQAELNDQIAADRERLARVEARLHQIEREDATSNYDISVKPLDALRAACMRGRAPDFGAPLPPIFRRLFAALHAELARLGVKRVAPDIALYEDSGDEAEPIAVIAGVPVDAHETIASDVIEVVELAPVPRAVTTIHHGSMSDVAAGYEALLRWADDTGERVVGYSREIYVDSAGPPRTWITELQFVLAPTEGT